MSKENKNVVAEVEVEETENQEVVVTESKLEKIKHWGKEHKKAIVIGLTVVGGAIAAVVIGKKLSMDDVPVDMVDTMTDAVSDATDATEIAM